MNQQKSREILQRSQRSSKVIGAINKSRTNGLEYNKAIGTIYRKVFCKKSLLFDRMMM